MCSHCIISKKIGMVAFLSSGSGTNVTSRMGPTIAGMNFILWGPEGQRTLSHRNIIVLFEEAINHIFILNKERTNLIMWQTKQQQNMKPDNKNNIVLLFPLHYLQGMNTQFHKLCDNRSITRWSSTLTEIIPHISDLKSNSLPHVSVSAAKFNQSVVKICSTTTTKVA